MDGTKPRGAPRLAMARMADGRCTYSSVHIVWMDKACPAVDRAEKFWVSGQTSLRGVGLSRAGFDVSLVWTDRLLYQVPPYGVYTLLPLSFRELMVFRTIN